LREKKVPEHISGGKRLRAETARPDAARYDLEREQPFQAVEQRRTFEQILLQVEDAIIDGRLQPGDRLAAERDLAQTFGVSRASVREALRVLEMFGVIVARRGTGSDAGSIVADGAKSGLQNSLRLHAGLLRIPTRDLVEVRAVLEQTAARKAADRRGDGHTERLREIVGGMRSTSEIHEFNGLDTEFHVELARASGNALLPVLMEALRGTMRRAMLEGFERLPDWRPERDHLVGEHERMITYIEAGDSVAAGSALQNHVMRFYRHVMEPESPVLA
jgi:GntR family transcriptional regulator, transcriptional repressor for pyruvate dehydrogenase complex